MNSHARLLDRLAGREYSGMKLGLGRFRRMLADLGHPERRLTRVLVAGTNGKGSVATILARILQASGHRTGLFTSPHLLHYRERVRVDGRAISRVEISDCLAELGPALDRHGGSFFEAMTGLGMLHFQRRQVDVAVFEVGLGGRLDATNVGTPRLSVLVGIGLDHTHILGHTLAAIAREKAAIARRARPVVCGATGRAVAALAREIERVGAQPVRLGEDARYRTLELGERASRFSYRGRSAAWRDLELSLAGGHQVRNAALALLAAETLGLPLRHVPDGLRSVRWPGRLELIDGHPSILLDGAHNSDGARSLAQHLTVIYQGERRLVGLVGVLKPKNPARFLRPLIPCIDRWVVTRAGGERAMEPAELAKPLGAGAVLEPELPAALDRARRLAGRRGLVCVCGSLRLVAEVMRLGGRRRLDLV